MRRLKKIIKWLLISLGIIIALIISTGFIIAYFYGDEVKERVVEELNQYINTEITVSDINFSIFKKFPNAVIELKDVVAKSTNDFNKNDFKANCDTLFTAESLFLKFNIIDIIRKNYKLKFIDVYNGDLNIYIDLKGNDNFHFWKETEGDTSDFELQLQKILLNDIKLNFINKTKSLELETYTSNLELAGDFNSGDYKLSTDGEFKIYKFIFDGVNYFAKKNVKLNLDLDVLNDNYSINSGNLKIENLLFNISGNVNVETSNKVNLTIKGKDIDVKSFISLLPSKYKEEINDFSSNGLFYFNSTIVGVMDNISTPHIEIDFGVQNGEVQRKGSNIKLTNVNVKGNYSNGEKNNTISSILNFSEFDIKMGNSHFQGSYKMKNFKTPEVELIANSKIELKELSEFFEFDSIENISGLFEIELKYQGTLSSMNEFTVKDFRKAKTEGNIIAKNCELKIEGSSFDFKGISGGFTFKNNDLKIDSLDLVANENDFFVKGYFKNILSYILVEGQNLNIDGFIRSKSIDVEKLFTIEENDDSGYNFPDNIQINANIEIEHFKFDRFIAENVLGKIIYTNKALTSSPLNFNTMDGSLKTTGTIYQNADNTFTTKCVTTLSNIDINKLFYTFKDFGQDFIKQEHIKGTLVSDIEYSSNWTNNFNVTSSNN